MAVLTLIIMLLLSITLGMAWKHWELLKDVRKERAEARDVFGDEIAVDGDGLSDSTIAYGDENTNKYS